MNLQTFFFSILSPVFVVAAFLSRILAVLLFLRRTKKAYTAAADEPFTQFPLRPPGESLRLKIEKLSSDLDDQLVILCLTGVVATTTVIYASPPSKGISTAGMALLVGGVSVWCGRRIIRLAHQLWNHRLGFTGERVVGEELNQLLASGFRVFHDVPFDTFNIDHVLVGPPGVYAVETKTRRKPNDLKGSAKTNVVFDGTALHFPKHRDTRSLEQARRNARTLADWLTRATGEHVHVNAVLTLPGWFVDRKAKSDVNVLNPAEIKRSFPNRPIQPLAPSRSNASRTSSRSGVVSIRRRAKFRP